MRVNVNTRWADLPLLLCYFITGLLDAASVTSWGSFASMQTGNTIYLGYGLVAPADGNRWIRALVALASFSIGSFLFPRFHRFFSPRKRWVLLSSYAIQALFIAAAALMVTLGPTTDKDGPISVWVLVPISLIALQASGQAFMSRVLKYGSLTSVVLTSIYCDLWADENLFAGLIANPERNRRVAAPIMLLLGAIVAGACERAEAGIAGALWTAAGMKVLVIILWCFWREDELNP
jgi:uncharacterized membrane protein YoaK (UPF0700 family)